MGIAALIIFAIAIAGAIIWFFIKNKKEEPSVEQEKPVSEAENKPVDEVPTEQEKEPEKPKEEVVEEPASEDIPPKPTLDKPDMQEPANEEPVTVISNTETVQSPTKSFDDFLKSFSEYVEVPHKGMTEGYLIALYNEACFQICESVTALPRLYKQELFPNVTDEIWGNKKDEGAAYNTMMGWLFALQLAELKPKKRNQIFKVGYELGGHTYGTPVYGFEFRSDPNVARLVASIIYVGMRGKLNPDIAAMRAEVGGTSYPYGLSYYLDLGLNHLKTADDIQKNVVSKGGFYVDLRQFMPSSAGPYDKNYKERPEHVMEALVIDSYKNLEWDKCLHEHIVKTYNLDSTDPEIHQATVQAIADKEQSTNHLYGKNKSFNGYHFHPAFGLDTIGKEIPTAGATANLTFSIQAIATYFRLILQNKVDNPAYYGRLRPGCDWTQEKKKNSDTDDRRNVLVDIAIEDNDGQKTSSYGYDDDGIWRATEVEASEYAEHQKNHLGANSYPSGHSSGIWCVAMMLAEAMPDRADLIMKEANQFSINRTITRFHWTSDTIYGRVLGSVASAMCHATYDYDALLEATKKELFS